MLFKILSTLSFFSLNSALAIAPMGALRVPIETAMQDSTDDMREGWNQITGNGRTLDLTSDSINVGNINYHCTDQTPEFVQLASFSSSNTCQHFNRFARAGVPEVPLRQALYFYEKNKDKFSKQRYISIADYSQRSTQKRFYILDMQTGEVRKEKVAHGSGARGKSKAGDENHDGMIDRCHHGNNLNDRENMTRAGFFVTRNFYQSGKHTKMKSVNGRQVREWPYIDDENNNGLRMEGLTPGVNDEALNSGVVMHGAWYNDVSDIMGRSYGCPAFESDVAPSVLGTLRGGTLYYSYTPRCRELHSMVERQIEGWESMCSGQGSTSL